MLGALEMAELGAQGGLNPLSLGLRLLLLFALNLITLSLDVLVVDSHGFVDLGPQGVVIINAI